ncbi:cell division protein FtsH [Tyzzerella sp. An114]|uniref:ATP-dependent zinc metalloprotease FtsH n=1 Tax=Tyzzerella sp. An114 TaxID=1965545 RepID=UPI000B44B94B|nr:ATP-dependent zinc metalloprotease FtsH [Tyzzerella sp. An114]OUQ58524.1 cell division protein FtsH [Tyzzerella sp. An114]HIT72474.1 ATP-dependent zinc metalloprotease FtsH [Candidatus Fimicola cottocaccae]
MPTGKEPKGNGNDTKTLMSFIIMAVIFTSVINIFMSAVTSRQTQEISYTQFLQMLDDKKVATVERQSDRLIVTEKVDDESQVGLYQKHNTYIVGAVDDPELTDRIIESGAVQFSNVENNSVIYEFMVSWVLPSILIYIVVTLLMRSVAKKMGGGGGPMSFGKNTAKIYAQKETGVTFADVAGQEEAKESLNEIVDFLHQPEKYNAIGAKLPKGALLVGPPGTGKTLLAKAVAGEANVPFYSLSGSDFVEMFVGVGASRVRDLFKQAVANAPCIVFIDEIDAIGKSRDNQMGGNDEREQTLNQLLSEMDGFDSSKGVVILGATNRPEVLDKALLRPGRFDRRVIVEKPDLKGREDILKVHVKDVKLGDDVDLNAIALGTSGCAGADIANIVNEAALRAVRLGRDKVNQSDFMEAIEVIIAGKEKKDRILTEKEKKIVAYHEVGHALATALQKNTMPVQKITIVPRTMGSLGYTMQMPEEEKYLMSKEEMIEQITTLLAGRAAEEVIFNTVTTGASNDIERATAMARAMVAQYGMSDRFDMMGLESIQNKYLDGRNVRNCAEVTSAEVDSEVLKIITDCHKNAIDILKKNEGVLHKIAAFLIEKETITGKEFMEILESENSNDEKEKVNIEF